LEGGAGAVLLGGYNYEVYTAGAVDTHRDGVGSGSKLGSGSGSGMFHGGSLGGRRRKIETGLCVPGLFLFLFALVLFKHVNGDSC
jgi:hypothetical protein